MGETRKFRFDNWVTAQDPEGSAEYEVTCVSPTSKGGPLCRWSFSVLDAKDEAEAAQRDHVEKTSHRRFWEHSRIPTLVTAPPGSVVAGRVARYERAVAELNADGEPARVPSHP